MRIGECFHCGSKNVVWDSDDVIDDSDFGETIIHECHCEDCGSKIRTFVIDDGKPKDMRKLVKNQFITRRDPEDSLYTQNKGECPSCGADIWECENPHFCGFCGQGVKW